MLKIYHITAICPNCKVLFTPSTDSEGYTSSEECKMGTKNLYTWNLEDSCPQCNEPYSAAIDACEYPVGVKDYQSIDFQNGISIEKCEIDVE